MCQWQQPFNFGADLDENPDDPGIFFTELYHLDRGNGKKI